MAKNLAPRQLSEFPKTTHKLFFSEITNGPYESRKTNQISTCVTDAKTQTGKFLPSNTGNICIHELIPVDESYMCKKVYQKLVHVAKGLTYDCTH